jgi:hypothetical protein
MLAAYVWHWWIGVALVLATFGAVVALAVGYLKQVQAPQYPRRRDRR